MRSPRSGSPPSPPRQSPSEPAFRVRSRCRASTAPHGSPSSRPRRSPRGPGCRSSGRSPATCRGSGSHGARLPRLPRPRRAGRRGLARPARGRRGPRARPRARARLGAARRRRPVALSRRRPHRAPARAGRVLERPGAARRRGGRVRALGGPWGRPGPTRRREPARLRGRRRPVPDAIARGGTRRGRALTLWLVLSDERPADALRAALATLPAALVVGWAFTALRSSRTAPSAATGSTPGGSSPSYCSSAPPRWSRPRGGRRSPVSSPTTAGRCWWS